ncbi:MAG TPA: site-specific integrase [Terriglobales bacterium]|jgi:integrase|nr:site-specific integrase [Terriglobales bacterium]
MALRIRGGKWHYNFKFDGKRYGKTTGLDATKRNETAARDKEAEHRQALREGRSPRRILAREFPDAAKAFLGWAETQYRAHPNSYRRIATSFASIREFFGREAVSLIDEARVESYMTWRVKEHEVRDVTLRHDLHALSKFFGHAIKQHWARENPIRNVKIPSDEDAVRIHVLSAFEERQYFVRAGKHRDLHDLGRLMLNQGPRPDEVTSLAKADVDLEHRRMYIRRGKSRASRRKLDLTAESCRILAERMAGKSPWIFPSSRNPGQHVARVNNAHDRLCAKAQADGVALDFVLYDLRHTFATRMAQEGIDLATLARILGHNSIRIVERYVHPTDEHRKSAMLRYEASQMALSQAGQVDKPN